jgi:hypothetical protein
MTSDHVRADSTPLYLEPTGKTLDLPALGRLDQ